MIFLLQSLPQVVPASLHINLGVTLLLYNELLKECRKLDEEDGVTLTKEQDAIYNEWEFASIKLNMIETEMQVLAQNVITMINHRDRLQAVLSNDSKKNNDLAMCWGQFSVANRERRRNSKPAVRCQLESNAALSLRQT